MNPRDTAIEALEAVPRTGNNNVDFYVGKALAALRSEVHEERWISVEERLPELHEYYAGSGSGQSEEVLVCYIDQEGERQQMVDVLQRGGQGDTTTVHWCNAYGVIHWMPLPQPPKP